MAHANGFGNRRTMVFPPESWFSFGSLHWPLYSATRSPLQIPTSSFRRTFVCAAWDWPSPRLPRPGEPDIMRPSTLFTREAGPTFSRAPRHRIKFLIALDGYFLRSLFPQRLSLGPLTSREDKPLDLVPDDHSSLLRPRSPFSTPLVPRNLHLVPFCFGGFGPRAKAKTLAIPFSFVRNQREELDLEVAGPGGGRWGTEAGARGA